MKSSPNHVFSFEFIHSVESLIPAKESGMVLPLLIPLAMTALWNLTGFSTIMSLAVVIILAVPRSCRFLESTCCSWCPPRIACIFKPFILSARADTFILEKVISFLPSSRLTLQLVRVFWDVMIICCFAKLWREEIGIMIFSAVASLILLLLLPRVEGVAASECWFCFFWSAAMRSFTEVIFVIQLLERRGLVVLLLLCYYRGREWYT